ncbi:hypothetical protein BGZ54_010134 [Gamsiella multidivaricata]|nr:hypothetical protein BGZ54_010134 [Gamsiella multidivaricata]
MREKSSPSHPLFHSSSCALLVPTPYRPHQQRKEYGIPFHGQRIYHRAQFIRSIDFGALVSVLSTHHFEILARSTKLGFRTLDLRRIRLPFSNHLLSILMNSKALRQLTLGHLDIPLEALVYLEPCFSGLKELRLVDCPDTMGDAQLSMVLRHCSQLTVLELQGNSFTDESLCWIGKACVELEVLVIGAPKMSDAVVEQIAAACTRLRSWTFVDCTSLQDATVEALEQNPPFALTRYASTLRNSAATLGKLSTIHFRNCSGIRPQLISSFLRSQPGLEYLVLGGSSITDEALESLTETPLAQLDSLSLIDCGEISDESMVAVMFNCNRVKKLTIFGSHFTLRTFSSISLHLTQLEELHLEHVPLVMNESLQDILVRCRGLRALRLWHCRNVTQDLFADHASPCASLEVLEYMDKFPRPYADDGCDTQVRFLQSLVIQCERLRVLRLAKLADTWVPVNLVSYLCQLDRLEKFTILQNPGLDLIDLKELKARLPTLVHIGVGVSDSLSKEDLVTFAQSHHRPGVQMYDRMLESSDDLQSYGS